MATYTSNYGWTKPSGSDNVDISVLNNNLDNQDSTIHDAFLNMAPPFSESSTYAVDDIVLYGTGLYKCHTAVVTPGSWTGSTNWQVYKLSEGGSGGGGTTNYNQLTNKPQINSVELSGNKTAGDFGLQGELTFDNVPTDGSNNPVKSDGIYDSEKDIYAVMGKMGAKNLIPYPYYESDHTESGITWTVNSDGSVTANGTATANSTFVFRHRGEQTKFIEKNTSYIFSGCPSGGSNSTYSMAFFVKNQDDSNIASGVDFGDGITINMPNEDYYGIYAFARVFSGQTVSNLTFKPMLRLASITDDTYQPYAKTNKELTEAIKNIPTSAGDISYDNTDSGLTATDVQEAVDEVVEKIANSGMTVATLKGTAHTVANGTSHSEAIPITYPTGYTRVIGVVGFDLGNSVLTPWQIKISGDNVNISAFNHYTSSANAKTEVTLLFAK